VTLPLMVIVPTLRIGMARAPGPLAQLLLGRAAELALAVGGVHIYRLGKPA
jgi:hypothetical protein